jgi:hypothetical protein
MFYNLVVSVGFGILYMVTAFARVQTIETSLVIGVVTCAVFLLALVIPPRIFSYTNDNVAPRVQTQVINRAMISTAIIMTLNVAVWVFLARNIPLLEELYGYSLVEIFLCFGFAGAIASHVVYLQQTKQYNSNQLVAVIGVVTLILFVMVLVLLALDWAIARDAYVHLRDLILITLILLSYGRAVYLMAHH